MAIKSSPIKNKALDPLEKRVFGFRQHILGRIWPNILAGRQDVSGRAFKIYSPLEPETLVAGFIGADLRVVEEAALGASACLQAWAGRDFAARAAILAAVGENLRQKQADLALALYFEAGYEKAQAMAEVARVTAAFTELSDPAFVRQAEGYRGFGVVGLIADADDGFALLAMMSARALVAGNCIIVRPAAKTYLASILLIEALQLAGLGDGVVSLVCGSEAGLFMAACQKLDRIFHFGPEENGLKLQRKAGLGQLISLGAGKNRVFIAEDADLAAAVSFCVQMAKPEGIAAVHEIFASPVIFKEISQKLRKAKVGIEIQSRDDFGPEFGAEAGVFSALFAQKSDEKARFLHHCAAQFLLLNPTLPLSLLCEILPLGLFMKRQIIMGD